MSTMRFDNVDDGVTQVSTTALRRGIARAWVNFDALAVLTVDSSLNTSSVTDNGVGDYTENISAAQANANYPTCGMGVCFSSTNITGASMISAAPSGSGTYLPLLKSTTQFRFYVGNPASGALLDAGEVSLACFGW